MPNKSWESPGPSDEGAQLHNIVSIGDSNTAFFWPTEDWTTFGLGRRLGAYVRLINKGISQNTINDMQARFDTDVKPYRPIYVNVMAGTIDLGQGDTAATVEADLTALYASIRGIGAIPIPITVPPRGGTTNWTAAKETERQAVNAWIVAGTSGYRGVNIEPYTADYTDPLMPVIIEELRRAYGHSDSTPPWDLLHINPNGHEIVAREIFRQFFGNRPMPRV